MDGRLIVHCKRGTKYAFPMSVYKYIGSIESGDTRVHDLAIGRNFSRRLHAGGLQDYCRPAVATTLRVGDPVYLFNLQIRPIPLPLYHIYSNAVMRSPELHGKVYSFIGPQALTALRSCHLASSTTDVGDGCMKIHAR